MRRVVYNEMILGMNARDPAQRVDPSDTAFWKGLRQHILPLRPSQYDLTSRCNLSCEGCLFFSGSDYVGHRDADDPAAIEAFFAAEAERGVRFAYFGGAEPSNVMQKLVIAARHLPYGVVFTNGTQRITSEVPYRIHISIWGNSERSKKLRGADILKKQLANYRGDKRAVFVFTITAQNIGDIEEVALICAANDIALSFNHYSPTAKYLRFVQDGTAQDKYHSISSHTDNLLLQPHHLEHARELIDKLLDDKARYKILYSHEFNALIHHPDGLYAGNLSADQLGADCGVRLTSALRHYNTDLTQSNGKCCTPNVECKDCRLYAQSLATVLSRGTRHMRQSGGEAGLIRLWRLWCDLFLNDDRFRSDRIIN